MNNGDFANKRRMNEEAQHLREQMTKAIKLMVTQDAMNRELKEKLKLVEGDRERLQQNLLDLQMKYDTLSGQHQDKLRRRSEILNKVCSTHKMCEVLEEHTERLRPTLSRNTADRAILYEAYQRSGKKVCELTQRQVQLMDTNRQVIQDLQTRVKQMIEYQQQLANLLTSTKQQADEERSELQQKLDKALTSRNELFTTLNNVTKKLDIAYRDIKKKDEAMSIHQKEINQMVTDFKNQMNIAGDVIKKKENE